MIRLNRSILLIKILIFISIITCNGQVNLLDSQGYIDVTGGKLWYRILKEGSKTPLIIVHGGPGGTCWGLYPLAELSKDRPVIFYDQLGGGRSDHHNDTTLMTIENFVEQLDQLVKALSLDSFYIYGHSWGTTLALEYYLKHPQGIKAIIFNSPMFSEPMWSRDADTLINYLPDSIQEAIEKAEINDEYDSPDYQNAIDIYYNNYLLRGDVIFTKLDTAPAKWNENIYLYMWGPSEFTATGTLKNYDITHRLSEIKTPTLFITGEFDEALPSTVKYFQSLVLNSEFIVIKEAGHITMHDNLKENISAIRVFLNEIEKE